MSSPDLPPTLHSIRDNWRLLQEKLGDTVLERGILLPHPQDSYEALEERLLEALELPVRPRARILKCGHYMGPETPISSSEDERDTYFQGDERKWCDICGRDVKIEGIADGMGEQRFCIKIYASNGLMRAGAWAAAWREMERVDVEIEPFVEGGLAVELEHMAASTMHVPEAEHNDGFEDEEEHMQHMHESSPKQHAEFVTPEDDKIRRRMLGEERMREIYGPDTPFTPCPPVRPREAELNFPRSVEQKDSLLELLIAAFKVAVRDKKNVAIGLLSILVLMLAFRPGSNPSNASMVLQQVPEVMTSDSQLVAENVAPRVVEASAKVSEVLTSTSQTAQESIVLPVAEMPIKPSEELVVSTTEASIPEVETAESRPTEIPIQEESVLALIDPLVDSPKSIPVTAEGVTPSDSPIVDAISKNSREAKRTEEIPI